MNDRKRVLLHIICWMTFLFLPLFLSYINGKPMDVIHFLHMLPNAAILAILFYLNYFVLIDKLLFKKQVILYILVNALLVLAILALSHFVLMPPAKPIPGIPQRLPMHGFGEHLPGMMLHQGTTLIFFIVLSVAIRMTYNSYMKDLEIQVSETEKSKAELTNLKSQLNPHFLFNSLNNIYSLAAIDADKTQYAVHNLSDLLRYVLYESNNDVVPLSKEIAFIKSYTELMKLRLTPDVDFSESYPDDGCDTLVAPLLFIPLIENAFKHGIDATEPSFVHIAIAVTGDAIVCNTENSNHPKNSQDRSGHGIGVDNLKKRLDFLYPGSHTFNCGVVDDVYKTELIINIKGNEREV